MASAYYPEDWCEDDYVASGIYEENDASLTEPDPDYLRDLLIDEELGRCHL